MNVINLLSESAASSRSHKTSSILLPLANQCTHTHAYTHTNAYNSSIQYKSDFTIGFVCLCRDSRTSPLTNSLVPKMPVQVYEIKTDKSKNIFNWFVISLALLCHSLFCTDVYIWTSSNCCVLSKCPQGLHSKWLLEKDKGNLVSWMIRKQFS